MIKNETNGIGILLTLEQDILLFQVISKPKGLFSKGQKYTSRNDDAIIECTDESKFEFTVNSEDLTNPKTLLYWSFIASEATEQMFIFPLFEFTKLGISSEKILESLKEKLVLFRDVGYFANNALIVPQIPQLSALDFKPDTVYTF